MEKDLTKRDVARRQLMTAIELFFQNKDLVSVLSLATNAWEVVDALCTRAGVVSMSNQARENVRAGKDLKIHYINQPCRNFFKHADTDPDAVLEEFDEKSVEGILFLAVEDYIRLFKQSPLELQVFQAWYLAINEEKIAESEKERVSRRVEELFPGILDVPRSGQLKMGLNVLMNALLDPELRGDPSTE
jgi:hypothetical protein